MAKKKTKIEANDNVLNVFHGKGSDNGFSCGDDLDDLVNDMAQGKLPDEEQGKFLLMYTLASNGVTPEEYAQLYHVYQTSKMLVDGIFSDSDSGFFPLPGSTFGRSSCKVKEYAPLKNADDSTLVLKIQMKDVAKPPMWREVEIPANFNFMQLHGVIQAVTGLVNCHLWQFNAKAYDPSLTIGVERDADDPFGFGLDSITHDSEETPVTQFLQQKGDKLEYVYDFGDDWIFVVEVKDLTAKKSEYPVCRKYKCDLNAIDDFGGVWGYRQARQDLEGWGKYSKKEKKQRFESYDFDSENEYLDFLNEHCISLDDLNEYLMLM